MFPAHLPTWGPHRAPPPRTHPKAQVTFPCRGPGVTLTTVTVLAIVTTRSWQQALAEPALPASPTLDLSLKPAHPHTGLQGVEGPQTPIHPRPWPRV